MTAGRIEKDDFEEEAKAILKSEVKRMRLTYAELADRFSQLGVAMSEPTLRNKISRGSFSAAFFLQCLMLIGAQTIRLPLLESHLSARPSDRGQADA